MSINLHNYESWFQLYVDGELDAQQMLAVEAFTQKHPDLELVLEQLMQTVLEPETFAMPGKHLLLKPEQWDENNLEEWQQNLMLHLDGESNSDEPIPAIHQAEWQRLQHTKLQPEIMAMANKDSLMSHNMRRTPVIAISWVKRIAVAAVAAGIVWALWPNAEMPANNGKELVEATNNKTGNNAVAQKTPATDNSKSSITEEYDNAAPVNFAQYNNEEAKKQNKAATNTAIQQAPVQYAALTKLEVIENTPVENNQVGIDVLSPAINTKEINASTEIVAAVQPDQQNLPEFIIDEEYLGDNEDAEEMVNIGGIKVKKNKIRGILRSVSRNVSRRTSTEAIQEAIFPR